MTCKDCELGSKRPSPHPGPRCATHHRAELKRRREAARDKRIEQTYGLTADQYEALYAFQGGTCAICRKARGVSRRLAVDHDHAQAVLDGHDPDKGCQQCCRGLLCKRCNRTIGDFRDSPEAFERAATYLRSPPYRQLLSG